MGSEMCIRDSQYPVTNLSPNIKALYATLESDLDESVLSTSSEGQLFSAESIPEREEKGLKREKLLGYSGINPTQEEREEIIEKLYPLPEDRTKFEREIGEDLGIENLPKLQPLEQYDIKQVAPQYRSCLLYTSPSPRDLSTSRMPSSA